MAVYELKDKVVLVTGGGGGIGAGVVSQALEHCAKHVAILDIDEKAGTELQNEMNKKYGVNKSKFYKCDVTNEDQLFAAYDSTIEQFGYVDVVVNNAGIMNDSKALFKKEIEINVTALVNSTLKALELMRKDEGGKGGAVINVSSVAGLCQVSVMPIYWATKAAVIQFSNCIGKEDYYDQTGVRVVAICFGATDTALKDKIGGFDKDFTVEKVAKNFDYFQRMESAALGVIRAYQNGASGSTWVSTRDEPAVDITHKVSQAYQIMGQYI